MAQDIQIRYSRANGEPRNTLVTIRNGDKIFFGVAVCRPNERVNKELGKKIAIGRAWKAREKFLNNHVDNWARGQDGINTDGVMGVVHREDIVKLLRSFESI